MTDVWTEDDVQSLRNDLADAYARLQRARYADPPSEHAAARKVENVARVTRSVAALEQQLADVEAAA